MLHVPFFIHNEAPMSISEARRQIQLLEKLAEEHTGNSVIQVIYHSTNALVEALATTKSYDGDLNTVQISVHDLFQIVFELKQLGEETIGLESLLLSLHARYKKSNVDNS
jgi:hypothetical protein